MKRIFARTTVFVFIFVSIFYDVSFAVGELTYLWPVQSSANFYISRGVTDSHKGIDIVSSDENVLILATCAGTVEAADGVGCTHYSAGSADSCNGAMGNYVQIRHKDGRISTYMHLMYNGVFVKKGDVVQQGQVIGIMGSSGRSTAQHLHFQIGVSWENNIENTHPDVFPYIYTPETGLTPTLPPTDLEGDTDDLPIISLDAVSTLTPEATVTPKPSKKITVSKKKDKAIKVKVTRLEWKKIRLSWKAKKGQYFKVEYSKNGKKYKTIQKFAQKSYIDINISKKNYIRVQRYRISKNVKYLSKKTKLKLFYKL